MEPLASSVTGRLTRRIPLPDPTRPGPAARPPHRAPPTTGRGPPKGGSPTPTAGAFVPSRFADGGRINRCGRQCTPMRRVPTPVLVAAAVCLTGVGMLGGAGAVLSGGPAAGWHLFLVSFAAWMGAFVLAFLVVWNRGFVDR